MTLPRSAKASEKRKHNDNRELETIGDHRRVWHIYAVLMMVLFLVGIVFGYATDLGALFLSIFLPMIAPFYWVWYLWADGRGLFNLYSLACLVGVISLFVYGVCDSMMKKY